ncbi:hypothetical protein D9M68_892380 [compost metagenome]
MPAIARHAHAAEAREQLGEHWRVVFVQGGGEALEVIDEFVFIEAEVRCERRFAPSSFAAYRSADDDQSYPAQRAAL